MRKSHLHAYNSSGNISGTGITLGIIGLAINPLFGIIGALLRESIHNCITKEPPHEIPFWAKPDNGVNEFRNMTSKEMKKVIK